MTDRSRPNAAEFHAEADAVFDRIAGRYDLLCDLFSLGIHRFWKRRMADLIASEPWELMLDAAAGTGDIALRVRRRVADPMRRIVLSDLSEPMLKRARARAGTASELFDYRILDAHHMPSIPDASLDLFANSLALKICDRHRVMCEAWRVLKPGGRFLALEASAIEPAWLHDIYLKYMSVVMPTVGWLATGGDASAYRYLLDGIRAIPEPEKIADELRATGFDRVCFERLSLGIVAIHTATKPWSPKSPRSR